MMTKPRKLMTQVDLPGYGPYENREDYEEAMERKKIRERIEDMRNESVMEEKKDFGWEYDVINYLKQKGELPEYD